MIRKVKDHPIFVWMLVLIGPFGACALLYGNKLHAKRPFLPIDFPKKPSSSTLDMVGRMAVQFPIPVRSKVA